MARAFKFGDDISTDLLAPGHLLKLPPEDLARHCLAALDPEFPDKVEEGDILFAGRNFGLGSSREQAAVSLKQLGIRAVLATSFARIFYRNALNLGLPVFTFDAVDEFAAGQKVAFDLAAGSLVNLDTDKTYSIEPLSPHLMKLVDAGGLIPFLEKHLI